MIANIKLINVAIIAIPYSFPFSLSFLLSFSIVRTLKIYPLSTLQVYSIILLPAVPMLSISFPRTYSFCVTESRDPLTIISPFLPPSSSQQSPFYSLLLGV